MDTKDSPNATVSFPICGGKPQVPSEGETEALAAMKAIKERVRRLKDRRALLGASARKDNARKLETLENELASLKAEWDMWDEKRAAAAKERMILLGHEEGPLSQA